MTCRRPGCCATIHSPNLLWLPEREGIERVGLLDFQDALMGPPAYDLVSLLQDARVDVPEPMEIALLGRYVKARARRRSGFRPTAGFVAAYVTLGAQRATKILGIFARLDRRDGKPQYLRHMPRDMALSAPLAASIRRLRRLKAWYDVACAGCRRNDDEVGNDPAASIARRAMVLAAGLGTRMRPLTDTLPKPLVAVGGKALVDHVLDRLAAAGVDDRGGQRPPLRRPDRATSGRPHARRRSSSPTSAASCSAPAAASSRRCRCSATRRSSTSTPTRIWIEGVTPESRAARRARSIRRAWSAAAAGAGDPTSIGYDGRGDFAMAPDGRLRRRAEREVVPFVYAGAAMLSPALFADAPHGQFSLNRMFDRAIEAGRLHGLRLEGIWMHVGTPGGDRGGRSGDPGERD